MVLFILLLLCLLWPVSLSQTQAPKLSQAARKFYLREMVQSQDTDQDGVLSLGEFDNAIQSLINQCQADLESLPGEVFPVYCPGDVLDENSTACFKTMCPDAASVFGMFGLPTSAKVNPSLLGRLLTPVVYALSQGNCRQTNGSHINHSKPTKAEVWGYSLAFATLIGIVSNIGAFLVPIMNTTYYKLVLMFMVALAVGCMTGTSLFVLMPEAYNLMNVEEVAEDYLWKAGTIVLIIYFFFLTERVMNLIVNKNRRHKDKRLQSELMLTVDSATCEKKALELDHNGVGVNHGHSHGLEVGADGKTRVATVAWMVLIGDAIHNFMDGLAIGAGFTESVLLGLSISIAVICEEIPHELGDIAILVHSGLRAKKALFYNCLAAIVCYGGIIVGILLGENTSANQWVYAAASGMFLYVSLVDMLPEVNRAGDSEEGQALGPIKVCLIQNTGLLIGLGVIFILANYSGDFFE
ncbi:metal cation symporter ZIP14-like [Liolophura sinensis]|uniref:metal cation symporter ZIP14-like n=1 Tax=Liolophura sinensis TaxID=3198878 RepID=UPI003158355F